MIDVEAKIKEIEPRFIAICSARNLNANEQEFVKSLAKTSLHVALLLILKSLWHDANENPKRYDDYIVITKQGCVDMCFFDIDGWHEPKVGGGDVAMWLDLKDILPTKGGEQC